jgi:outer membrane lipoprotein SlyB
MILKIATVGLLMLATTLPLQQAKAQDALGGAIIGGVIGAGIGGAAGAQALIKNAAKAAEIEP